MEPAVEWREHRAEPARSRPSRQRRNGARRGMAGTRGPFAGAGVAHNSPQWSPPWNGGNTRPLWTALPRRRTSRNGARRGMAGTPTDGTSPGRRRGRRNGARRGMAGTRRPPRQGAPRGRGPQWSPPWNGGNTVMAAAFSTVQWMPQWSPPWNGGNTGHAHPGRVPGVRAAMEPAVEWREHRSTPVTEPAPGKHSVPVEGAGGTRRWAWLMVSI